MIDLQVWQWAVILSLLSAVGGLVMLPRANKVSRTEDRLRAVRLQSGLQADISGRPPQIWARWLAAIGSVVLNSGLLSRSAITDLQQTMAASGTRSSPALALFVGAKLCLFFGLPPITLVALHLADLHFNTLLVVAITGVLGLMLPDYVVRSRRKRYLKSVDDGLPAALDLLIICAEAGLAFEAGLERVADDSRDANAATANELRITASEMKILADRRQALTNMGTRTGLETMARLGSVLSQSMKYGTPLTQALRVLAAEMRQTTLTRFEARAAKIPVLLTIPMVLFILPCMFVVIGGPAAVRVVEALTTR
jgi:tight adherence protein C